MDHCGCSSSAQSNVKHSSSQFPGNSWHSSLLELLVTSSAFSSGIAGSVIAVVWTTVNGKEGGADGGGGHDCGINPRSAPAAWGGGGKVVSNCGITACAVDGYDHGEKADSQPHGAMQRTHAAHAREPRPSTCKSMIAGRTHSETPRMKRWEFMVLRSRISTTYALA